VFVVATVVFAPYRSRRVRRVVMPEPRGPHTTYVTLNLISFKASLWLLLFFLTHVKDDLKKLCAVVSELRERGRRDHNDHQDGIGFSQLTRDGNLTLWKSRMEKINMLFNDKQRECVTMQLLSELLYHNWAFMNSCLMIIISANLTSDSADAML